MNSEKGQALPLAILVLTIGTLLVTPFLGHASSSVIGSRIYAEAIAYRNACDAGVEHAIWRLVYGKLGASIPNPGDHITYQLAETINGVIPTVTVTTNTTGGGGSGLGDITGIIDSLDFDTSSGYLPDIIQVTGNIYVIAYQGASGDGFLKTVAIDSAGGIGSAAIDTLEYDTADCKYVSITHVSGTIFAVVYQGPNDDGFIKTFSVDSNGNISNSVIATMEFDTSDGRTPTIIQISPNVFAIVYYGPNNDGYIKTVNIDANGIMGSGAIKTMDFDTSNGQVPDIIHVSGNIYAIAYQGASADGFIKTVSIDINGVIGSSTIDTLEFDTADCKYVEIINISGNIFAVVYQGSGDDGFVKTFSIDTNGNIGNTTINSLEFDTTDGWTPVITNVSGNIYAVTYRGTNGVGIIKTISINSSGVIGTTTSNPFTFDASAGYEPAIVQVTSSIYAIAYRGPGTDGYVITIGIASSSGVNTYTIVAAAGNTSIQAYVSTGDTTASILSWQIK
jgi:hypothetical protein